MMCFNQKRKTYVAFRLVRQNYKLLVAQDMCCLTLYFGLSLEACREKVVNLSHDVDFSSEFELISFFKKCQHVPFYQYCVYKTSD